MNSEQENETVKTILERSKTECYKCVLWDETAKLYGKRGMCEDCFNNNFVNIKTIFQHDREF